MKIRLCDNRVDIEDELIKYFLIGRIMDAKCHLYLTKRNTMYTRTRKRELGFHNWLKLQHCFLIGGDH